MNTAVTLDRLDRSDEALAEFERALQAYETLPEHHPDRFFAWYGYGAALANAERLDDAIDAYEHAHAAALQALPDHLDLPETELELGRLTLRAGRPASDAIAWLEQSLEHLQGRPDGEDLRLRAEAELARARDAAR
jgi:tetratricopeptide (TPR) repeat protein